MFKFDNTHIFTGYLKQLLSTFNLPTCRIYTKEFADYLAQHGKEDPRVIESFDNITYTNNDISKQRIAARVNYLKSNELYNYFWDYSQNERELGHKNSRWKRCSSAFYHKDKNIPGLTKVLKSHGGAYDTTTHEYLGDYLRFLRDYYNINLMSLYNCFNNKICNNIYHVLDKSTGGSKTTYVVFDSQDSKYRIYAFPVKLFCDYTVAIDCDRELEMFCGLYNTTLDISSIGADLIAKTYKKYNRTFFNRPFLYDGLNVKYWNFDTESAISDGYPKFINTSSITRWDIANREQDLKLFIKVPVSCKSSITVLEGDFRNFNDAKYVPVRYKADGKPFNPELDSADTVIDRVAWEYQQNHYVINFGADINKSPFVPIGKMQLLAFNTGESYPFADRLVEYLCNSTITPIDEITDNIKRAQKVMSDNSYYFKIDGLWEAKMQKIIYDYMINTGPIELVKTDENSKGKLVDKRRGIHPRLGHTSKSTLYDVLGYVDKEAEKWYASWKIADGKATVKNSIQNVDIYNGLYDIE
jgi:hypothetical protein